MKNVPWKGRRIYINILGKENQKRKYIIRNKDGQSHKGISWLKEHKNLKCFLSTNSTLKFETKT